MWIIIILIIVAIIGYASIVSQKKEIKDSNISRGGMRKLYPIYTNYLETVYRMEFVNDTGLDFTYSKLVRDKTGKLGNLSVGVKTHMGGEPLIFSIFQSSDNMQYEGTDVGGVDFEKIETIEKCIKISLGKLSNIVLIKEANDRLDRKQDSFLQEWVEFKNGLEPSNESNLLRVFIDNFFIPDRIAVRNFCENFDVLQNSWKKYEVGFGTESVKDIFYIPPAFSSFFIGGYPDVYMWFEKNSNTGQIKIQQKLEMMSDEEAEFFLNSPKNLMHFYRSLITEYSNTGSNLECSVYRSFDSEQE